MTAAAAHPPEPPAPAYEGWWQALSFTPDLGSQQSYLIGVLAHHRGQLDAFRVLQDFTKFDCLYGPGAGGNITYLVDRARTALSEAQRRHQGLPDLHRLSPHFALTEALFASGDSAETAVNALYRSVVALEPHEKPRKLPFLSRDQDQVRLGVYALLKQQLALDFERVIHPKGISVQIDNKRRPLDVDIFTGEKGVCGVITSGWYSSLETIELHALRGLQDLHAAHHHYHARVGGLVLVRPHSGLPEKFLNQVDRLMDKHEHKVKASGLKFYAPASDEEAAEIVQELIRL